jgi:hypothetical protein
MTLPRFEDLTPHSRCRLAQPWENTVISPDYVGATREVVKRETGAPCLFLQGASGELGPREGFVGDTAVTDKNGRELGFDKGIHQESIAVVAAGRVE